MLPMSAPTAVALLLALLPCLAAESYNFEKLTVAQSENWGMDALSINNRGAVVGFYATFRRWNGFKLHANDVLEFPIIHPNPNTQTVLTGINDHGEMVGYYRQSNQIHGFRVIDGSPRTYIPVDVKPGVDTYVYSINNLGDFAGEFRESNSIHGFVSIGGAISQIDVPGAGSTMANAVAWDGTVVGRYYSTSGVFGFLRGPKGKFLRFQIANAIFVAPLGINNEAGKIVGWYRDTSDKEHGFVYDYVADLNAPANGAEATVRTVPVTTVDFPGAISTAINGINARGVIVGGAYTPTTARFGFIGTPK